MLLFKLMKKRNRKSTCDEAMEHINQQRNNLYNMFSEIREEGENQRERLETIFKDFDKLLEEDGEETTANQLERLKKEVDEDED